MSVHAAFEFGLQSKLKNEISSLKVIQMLLDRGWKLQRDGYVSYLPLGDAIDSFNWTSGIMSIPDLMQILKEKERQKELIGISMAWQDSEIIGDFLLYQDGSLSMSISGNRKMLLDQHNLKITDVNWYLTNLLPAFNQEDIYTEYFIYREDT